MSFSIVVVMDLNSTFNDFTSAESAVLDYCKRNFHPIRVDVKQPVYSFNKKVKDESRIRCLPDSAIYACRYGDW